MIHNIEGEFGKVRTFFHLPTQTAKSVFNYSTSAGWHLCNEKYRICRENGLESYIVFLTVAGCGKIRIADESFDLQENFVCIIPIYTPHEYYVQTGGSWEFYWLHINGISASEILEHIIKNYGYIIPAGLGAIEILSRIEDLIFIKSINKPSFEAQASSIISDIVHDLIIGLQDKENSHINEKDSVRKLMKYLETNFKEKISIKEICQSMFVSAAHLTRLYKEKTGFTPYEYLMRYRIMKSKELLLYTDFNLKEIALMTGFCTSSNYISQFKALEATTPDRFRKLTKTHLTDRLEL